MTIQQIQFNRLNPQFNQQCRILTSDLVQTEFFSEYTSLTELKERFSKRIHALIDTAEQPIVINVADLREKLLNMTAVKKVVFRTGALSVHLNDIICKPSSGNPDDIRERLAENNRETEINITIPGLILNVKYFISRTNTSFTYALNVAKASGRKHVGYSDRELAHPHWISRTSPCLGDFEGAIADAQNSLDIPLQVSVLIMYLEQYNFHDCAGAYIYKWAPIRVREPAPFFPTELLTLDMYNYPSLPTLFSEHDAEAAVNWLWAQSALGEDVHDIIFNDVDNWDPWQALQALAVKMKKHYQFMDNTTSWNMMLYALQEIHPDMVADDKTGFKTYVNQYEQAVIAITEFVRSIKLPKNEQLYFTWFYCGASTAETFLNNRNFTLLESYDIKNENENDNAVMTIAKGDPKRISPPWDGEKSVYRWPILDADQFHQVVAFMRSPYSASKQRIINQVISVREQNFTLQDSLDTLLCLTKGSTK